jgi:hypothetical protein
VFKTGGKTVKKASIILACVAVLGVFALANGLTTNDSKAESPGTFHVLLAYEGGYVEYNFYLTADDLRARFAGSLVDELLEGQPMDLSPQEAFAGISDLVDIADWTVFDNVVVMVDSPFNQDSVPCSWSGIKCCYSGLACCCKPKDPDEVVVDP